MFITNTTAQLEYRRAERLPCALCTQVGGGRCATCTTCKYTYHVKCKLDWQADRRVELRVDRDKFAVALEKRLASTDIPESAKRAVAAAQFAANSAFARNMPVILESTTVAATRGGVRAYASSVVAAARAESETKSIDERIQSLRATLTSIPEALLARVDECMKRIRRGAADMAEARARGRDTTAAREEVKDANIQLTIARASLRSIEDNNDAINKLIDAAEEAKRNISVDVDNARSGVTRAAEAVASADAALRAAVKFAADEDVLARSMQRVAALEARPSSHSDTELLAEARAAESAARQAYEASAQEARRLATAAGAVPNEAGPLRLSRDATHASRLLRKAQARLYAAREAAENARRLEARRAASMETGIHDIDGTIVAMDCPTCMKAKETQAGIVAQDAARRATEAESQRVKDRCAALVNEARAAPKRAAEAKVREAEEERIAETRAVARLSRATGGCVICGRDDQRERMRACWVCATVRHDWHNSSPSECTNCAGMIVNARTKRLRRPGDTTDDAGDGADPDAGRVMMEKQCIHCLGQDKSFHTVCTQCGAVEHLGCMERANPTAGPLLLASVGVFEGNRCATTCAACSAQGSDPFDNITF